MKRYEINYAIIKLSESKTINGAFTYYAITEGGSGGVFKMLMHDYEGKGGGLALWWHKQISFWQSEIVFKLLHVALLKIIMFIILGFSSTYINVNIC